MDKPGSGERTLLQAVSRRGVTGESFFIETYPLFQPVFVEGNHLFYALAVRSQAVVHGGGKEARCLEKKKRGYPAVKKESNSGFWEKLLVGDDAATENNTPASLKRLTGV